MSKGQPECQTDASHLSQFISNEKETSFNKNTTVQNRKVSRALSRVIVNSAAFSISRKIISKYILVAAMVILDTSASSTDVGRMQKFIFF